MNPTFLSMNQSETSQGRSGFFVGTLKKLPGRAPKRTPKSIDAEISNKEVFSACTVLIETHKVSLSQWRAIDDCLRYMYISTVTRDHLTVTLKSLVKRNILTPVVSDEECIIQEALGFKTRPRYYLLNARLIEPIVYELREQAWLNYTTINVDLY